MTGPRYDPTRDRVRTVTAQSSGLETRRDGVDAFCDRTGADLVRVEQTLRHQSTPARTEAFPPSAGTCSARLQAPLREASFVKRSGPGVA